MKIKSVKLENFRNYRSLDFDFNSCGETVSIIGQNAQGKTNMLEAIYLLALTASFRTSTRGDLIKWDCEYARVTGVVETARGDTELEVFIGNPPHPRRALKKNGVKTGTYNFIGNCRIVFFHPEDLNILYLGPDLRRKYLDILNIQLFPDYYRALRAYKKILEQRNSLLKNIKDGFASAADLDVWDSQLAEHGGLIMYRRLKTIRYINENIGKVYGRISGRSDDGLFLGYRSFFEDGDNIELEQIRLSFSRRLDEAKAIDLRALVTTVGPHRDDIVFELNGRPIGMHASRGEYRSILLALKLIELSYFEDISGEKPILLLDDVFSELDSERQSALINGIEGFQTILTTTGTDRIHAGLGGRDSAGQTFFTVREGDVMKKG